MQNSNQQLADIPEEFYSFETGTPFTKCIECERKLLEEGCEYMIERAIRIYPGYQAQDVIFDYAICMECAQRIHSRLSKESLHKMQLYFSRINFAERIKRTDPNKLNELTARCMVKDKPRNECTEFQIYAHCVGDQVFLGNPPYMVSGEAIEELTALLSDSTKEELGGFFHKHFGPDPELFHQKSKHRLLLI